MWRKQYMEKFSRTYTVKFFFGRYENQQVIMEPESTMVSVSYPLTVEMSISRSIGNAMNVALLTLYGLDETKRKKLAKDRNNYKKYIRMDIEAGYGGNQWLIYRGAVQECFSSRQGGETEFKTHIESSDAAIDLLLGAVSVSFTEGTDMITRLNNISSHLIDLQLGAISPEITFTKSTRGTNETGNPLNILRKTGIVNSEDGDEQTMSVDLGVVNFLRPNLDVISKLGELYIDDSFGLLGTPRRRDHLLSVQMLFEPAANLNQKCILNSKTLGIYGEYKVMGVSHNGIISGAKCGQLITTVDLFLGITPFNEV